MTHSILRSILERVPLLQAASVSARDAWSLPLDTVQSPGQPRVMGGALRFAVSAASVTWPSPRPWSTSDYTGQADYTSCYTPPHTVIGSPDRRFDHRFSGNFAEHGGLARPHRGFYQSHACEGCRPQLCLKYAFTAKGCPLAVRDSFAILRPI